MSLGFGFFTQKLNYTLDPKDTRNPLTTPTLTKKRYFYLSEILEDTSAAAEAILQNHPRGQAIECLDPPTFRQAYAYQKRRSDSITRAGYPPKQPQDPHGDPHD